MKKPKSIQLNIAKPCNEDWDKMTNNEHGRYCAQCQKTVIDFTGWGDAALFNFFSTHTSRVCGRFYASQLQKELHIPPQPKSRLYRIAIACGLTLMFAQLPEVYAGVKQQTEILSGYEDDGGDDKNGSAANKGSVRGQVLDENGYPVANARVELTVKGIKKMQTIADENGNYRFKQVNTGKYEISAKAQHKKATLTNIKVADQKETNINISITLGMPAPPPIMMGGAMPEPPVLKGDVVPEPLLIGEPAVPEPPTPPAPVKMGKPSKR